MSALGRHILQLNVLQLNDNGKRLSEDTDHDRGHSEEYREEGVECTVAVFDARLTL